MGGVHFTRMRLLLVLAAAACGGPAGGGGMAPPGTSPPETLDSALESELQALGTSTDPPSAVRRSRLLRALGRQAEALAFLETATDRGRERLDWAGLSALWREVGDVYLEMGRPQDALEAFGKRLRTAVSLGNQVERAFALVDAAYAFSLMGAMTRSDEALSEAQLLAGKELTRDPEATERVALTRERLNDPERALELLVAAQRGHEARGDTTGAARAAVLAAQLEVRAGRPQALERLDEVVGRARDPDPWVRLSRFRAEAAFRAGDAAGCQQLASAAVKLADRRGLQHESKIARVVLARCAGAAGRLDDAIASAEQAAALTEKQRQHLTGENARLEIGFEAFQIYRLLLGLQVRLPAARRVADAFVTMEKARARAHLDAAARSAANLTGPVGEVSPLLLESKAEAEDRLRRLTQELASGKADATAQEIAERHKNALWALEDVREEIEQQNPLIARIRLPRPATVRDVQQQLLEEDTLLVSYFVGEEQVVAVAVSRTDSRVAVLALASEQLSEAIQRFRWEQLLAPDVEVSEVRRAGRELYGTILGPFDQLVKKHRRLRIIPHGNLASLPFEALVDRSGKFLVEGHDVSYSLSATLGLEQARARRPARSSRRRFVGMGDPVYDWAAFRAGRAEGGAAAGRGVALWASARRLAHKSGRERSLGLERLPGTAKELKAIARLFGSGHKLYLRDQASEENVKAGALADARIVHLASHGLLEPHYQALALSLDPSSKEDGFLLHSEIAELELDADLVVLSACETGNTQMRSTEPIAGLALALRNAGARRVVVSLWPVDDAATARLMTEFYRPLAAAAEGAASDYGAALSDAKRQMISAGNKHPYYWAPFVLVGD
jgi:CHAT domain-containing protein